MTMEIPSVTGSPIGMEAKQLKIHEKPWSESNSERANDSGGEDSGGESDWNACRTVSWYDDHGEMHSMKIYGRPEIPEDNREVLMNTDVNIRCTLRPGEFLESGLGPTGKKKVFLSAKDIRRWELSYRLISKEKPLREYFRNFQERSLARYKLDHFENGLSKRSRTIYHSPWDDLFFMSNRQILFVKLLPVIYGSIHLTAWGFDFPTLAESILWKTSCLIIITLSFPVLPSFCIPAFVAYLDDFFPSLVISFMLLSLSLSTAARIFLVLESFISLRHVPIGVYAAVPWVQNIPHI